MPAAGAPRLDGTEHQRNWYVTARGECETQVRGRVEESTKLVTKDYENWPGAMETDRGAK
jgi:hypothetical protein